MSAIRPLWIGLIALGCLAGACGREPGTPIGGETSSSTESGEASETAGETDTTDSTDETGDESTDETEETGEPPPDLPSEPPLLPEAGYVSVPAHDYAIVPPNEPPTPLSADEHRQFFAFQPAESEAHDAPVFVFFNGGPAVSSGMLLGLNVGPMTFAPTATGDAEIADNPHSWTSLGNLLWIDAHHVGFSYSLLDDPADMAARQSAVSFANFNAYNDAADFVRVLLEFLAAHPTLRDNEVIVVAESYGGTRAQLMLDMLLHGPAYADGDRRLIDAELVARIAEHHQALLGIEVPPPEQVAQQFGRQILIQPALTGELQKLHAGELFEQPGSVVDLLAEDLGLDYVPCSEKQGFCSPFTNAHSFVQAAGRSPYDTSAPVTWLGDLFDLVNDRCNDTAVIEALLDVPLASVVDMAPAARSGAWRSVNEATYPSDADAGDLDETLGSLASWDRYFLVFEYQALGRFTGFEASQHGIDPDDPHYGEHLLRNLLWVETLITSSERDLVVYVPALANALRDYSWIVQDVQVGAGEWSIEYQPDAFGDWPSPGSRTIRVPSYTAGHAISMDAPAEFLADVADWLVP